MGLFGSESKFESSVKQIPYPQQAVYDNISDLRNLNKVQDRVPEDKVNDFKFDEDTVSLNVAPVGELKLRICDREEPKCVKFETVQSPVPFNLWIQVLPVDEHGSIAVNSFELEGHMLLQQAGIGLESLLVVIHTPHYIARGTATRHIGIAPRVLLGIVRKVHYYLGRVIVCPERPVAIQLLIGKLTGRSLTGCHQEGSSKNGINFFHDKIVICMQK